MMVSMSYPPEHKVKTHTRIVTAAAKSFRQAGMLATGIDQLMADAGLTRGGFYAHFRSKAALFAESLQAAFAEARENLLFKGLDKRSGHEWVQAASKRYLAKSHRDTPDEGCAIPALGAEVARAPDEVKEAFEREVDGIITAISERGGLSKPEATALLATWVGGITLARGMKDPAASSQVLEDCRAEVARRFPG